jgi:hypothetical protein
MALTWTTKEGPSGLSDTPQNRLSKPWAVLGSNQ